MEVQSLSTLNESSFWLIYERFCITAILRAEVQGDLWTVGQCRCQYHYNNFVAIQKCSICSLVVVTGFSKSCILSLVVWKYTFCIRTRNIWNSQTTKSRQKLNLPQTTVAFCSWYKNHIALWCRDLRICSIKSIFFAEEMFKKRLVLYFADKDCSWKALRLSSIYSKYFRRLQ